MTDPQLIELARVGAGLTQGALAHALGITQPFVSQVERGERPIPEQLIDAWAELCEVAPSFFRRSDGPMSSALAASVHRRLKTLPTKPFNVTSAQMQIASLEVDSLFQEVEVTPALELPQFPVGIGAADAADALRRIWRVPDGPIANLTMLVESAGVPVLLIDWFHEKHSGVAQRGRWFEWLIAINASHPPSRRRFTLGHELAHVVLGHDRRIAVENIEANSLENDAHAFAASLLLPERDALRELRRVTLRRLVDLKQRWRVSMAFLIRRAYECELLGEREQARLYMELGSLPGGRVREPAEFSAEEPTLIQRMVESLRSAGLSLTEIAETMTTSEARLRNVYLHERTHLRPVANRQPRARLQL